MGQAPRTTLAMPWLTLHMHPQAAQAALAEQRQAREAQRQRRHGRDHVSLNERAEREVAAAAERYRAMEAAREEEERRAAAAAKARPMGHRDPSKIRGRGGLF